MVYIPHVLAVGGKVIGFLPGYLQQEGYANGTRFGIIGLVVTGKLAIAVAVLILATVAFAVLQFSDPDRPWQGAVIMTAAALAVTTPRYEWYALLLVMLVALDGRPEWLAFAAGAYYAAEPDLGRYTIPNRLHDAVAYGVPVVVVAVGWFVREVAQRRGGAWSRCPSRPLRRWWPLRPSRPLRRWRRLRPLRRWSWVWPGLFRGGRCPTTRSGSEPCAAWAAGTGAFLPVGYP